MQNSQNLEPILTTLVTGEEEEVFEALLNLFPNGEMDSTPALTDCLMAYGEGSADVFNRFATRFDDDVSRDEFLISAAMQTQKSGTPEISNALLIAAESKVQGLDKNAELELARLLNKLGDEYYWSDRYAEAEPLFDEALSIRRRILGVDSIYTEESLQNLAGLYCAQGRDDAAEQLYEEALSVLRRELGADHPDTAHSLLNLAEFYFDQRRYAEAAPLYEEALTINRRALGADHTNTVFSLSNLASLYFDQGRYEDAEPLFEEALSISRRVLEADHPDTAESLNNLAELYRAQGRYEEAVPLSKGAVEIMEWVLGAEHPTTKIMRENYVVLLAEMKDEGR